jgi:hypothetical protein
MKIDYLRVLLSEKEINQHLPRLVPADTGVEDLQVRLAPEGVHLLGEYPTALLRVSFETLWEVSARDNHVEAHLAAVKVAGLPATLLRGILLKILGDMIGNEPGVSVENGSVVVDVAAVLQSQRVPVDVYLTRFECLAGELLIEAGPRAC